MQRVKDLFFKAVRAVKNAAVRFAQFVVSLFQTDEGFLTFKEQKEIARSNRRITKAFERDKKKKVAPSEYLTSMRSSDNVVEFDNLKTYFYTDMGVVKSVDGVSFNIPKNSTVGIVGESGCGKSVTALSLMRLVQAPQGQIVEGEIRFNSSKEGKAYNIAKIPPSEMYKIRGKEIAMIFQEPMTSLNSVFTIGNQLDEVVLLHIEGATKASAKERSIEMLRAVGIAMPEKVYKQYPHELSGGMRQRVMIAMAIICDPLLIVADEPTTALDVTIQAQILDLFRDVKQKINGSIMLITHDLGIIAEMADYVVIMYAGRIIERGTVREIFSAPKHPYTIGLQKSKPVLNRETEELYSIRGQVPSPINIPSGCFFKDRCDHCTERCSAEYPAEAVVSPTHTVACHLHAKD